MPARFPRDARRFLGAAGLPAPDGAAPGLRDLQLAQLGVVLPWAVRALDLPPLG